MSATRFDTAATDVRAMRGQPVIFLAVVALVWILGRVIAYLPDIGMADVRALPNPSAEVQETRNYIPEVRFETKTTSEAAIAQGIFVPYLSPAKSRKSNNVSAKQLILKNDVMVAQTNMTGLRSRQGEKQGSKTIDTRFMVPTVDYPEKEKAQLNRWSLQGWGYLRRSGDNVLAVGQGQYGGSQAGLIGRYALRPGGKRRMELYLRVSGALPNGERSGVGDAEFAFGASARPFESVPVALAVEQRIGIGGDALNRPAAYAITQIPPIGLPLDGKASAYAQFGMVGIDKPQLFFDTQILAERQVAKLGKIELSAGAGLWSGGQTGRDDTEADIYRLDIGPRASAVFPVGQGRARLSLGYRARVAGNADPGSGPALTLSTDF